MAGAAPRLGVKLAAAAGLGAAAGAALALSRREAPPRPAQAGVAEVAAAHGSVALAQDADTSDKPRTVAAFATGKGIIFRDGLEVVAASDPKVRGVTLYTSSVRLSTTDRLAQPFADPAQHSVAAAVTGETVGLKEPLDTSPAGEEVFSQRRNLFFKKQAVHRVYDREAHALLYIGHSTRATQSEAEQNSRFKTSIAVVPLAGTGLSREDVLKGRVVRGDEA